MTDLTDYRVFERLRATTETSFGEIAHVETGTGKPALFIHGLGLNSYYWAGIMTELTATRR